LYDSDDDDDAGKNMIDHTIASNATSVPSTTLRMIPMLLSPTHFAAILSDFQTGSDHRKSDDSSESLIDKSFLQL